MIFQDSSNPNIPCFKRLKETNGREVEKMFKEPPWMEK